MDVTAHWTHCYTNNCYPFVQRNSYHKRVLDIFRVLVRWGDQGKSFLQFFLWLNKFATETFRESNSGFIKRILKWGDMQTDFEIKMHPGTSLHPFWCLSSCSLMPLWILRLTSPGPSFTCNQCAISPTSNSEAIRCSASVTVWSRDKTLIAAEISSTPPLGTFARTHYLKSVSNYALWKDIRGNLLKAMKLWMSSSLKIWCQYLSHFVITELR